MRIALVGLVGLTTILAVAFLVTYHVQTRGDWRRSQMGRHLFVFTACIGLVTGMWSIAFAASLAGVELGDWYGWSLVGVFASIPVALAWRLHLLLQAQRTPEHNQSRETS